MLALAASGESAPLKFGVIADPQYADKKPRGTRYYRESLAKLEAAIAELNKQSLDFVVTLGDLIDEDYASFSEVMARYEALKAKHFMVFGNQSFCNFFINFIPSAFYNIFIRKFFFHFLNIFSSFVI